MHITDVTNTATDTFTRLNVYHNDTLNMDLLNDQDESDYNYSNSADSFEHSMKCTWSRLVKIEKLGIMEIIICLLVICMTTMVIVIIFALK